MSLSITNTSKEEYKEHVDVNDLYISDTENQEDHEQPSMPMTALQKFLWNDRQEPYYEAAHKTTNRTKPVTKQQALEALRRGASFFAPVPRVSRGNKKPNCATAFDVLWCDIDLEDGTDRDAALIEVGDRLEILMPLYPSAIVYSGSRGLHLYWKLTEDIPIEQIEQYNKALVIVLGGDSTCYERTHLLRNPGTINEKSGRRCELIEISGYVYDLQDARLLDELAGEQAASKPPINANHGQRLVSGKDDDEWLTASESLNGWGEVTDHLHVEKLHPAFKRYLLNRPSREDFACGGYASRYPSRSEIEQAIVYYLVGKAFGASDQQVIEFAHHFFAKHRDERKKGRGDRYIQITLNKARQYLYERDRFITSPAGGWPKSRDASCRWTTEDDDDKATALAHGQRSADWIKDVITATGHSHATIYRMLTRLRASGRLLPASGDHCVYQAESN